MQAEKRPDERVATGLSLVMTSNARMAPDEEWCKGTCLTSRLPAREARPYPGGPTAYIDELHQWCISQLATARERPALLALASDVRAKKLLLPSDAQLLLMRYQATLDNQVCKTMKLLREAQELRLKTIDHAAAVEADKHLEIAG